MKAFLTFIQDHLAFAIFMFAMSITAATLVIWRLLLNFHARTNMTDFLPHLQDTLNSNGVEGALDVCRAETGVIPRRMFVTGLENQPQGLAAMKRAMANVIELEILPDLNFLLAPILAIAKIATMVGLLGTVLSMIGTFQALGEAAQNPGEGTGGQAQASREIGLALFATALGLMTAIPLVFSHVLFKAWIHKVEIEMKSSAQKLLLLVQAMAASGRAPASPRTPARTPVGTT